jgi:lipoyl(octanoyl) transferase
VWTNDRKIASIGIHVKQWVSWHGFALNVTTDLSYFDLIVPCGIPGVEMTSIRRELSERAPRDLWSRAADEVVLGFAEVFDQTPRAVPLEAAIGSSQIPPIS